MISVIKWIFSLIIAAFATWLFATWLSIEKHPLFKVSDPAEEVRAKILQFFTDCLIVAGILSLYTTYGPVISRIPEQLTTFCSRYLNMWTFFLSLVLIVIIYFVWHSDLRKWNSACIFFSSAAIIIVPFLVLFIFQSFILNSGSTIKDDFNNIHWELNIENGNLVVTKKQEKYSELVFMDFSLTALESGISEYVNQSNDRTWKKYRDKIYMVEVRGFTDIGAEAFASCVNLREVNLPEKIEKIGVGAFRNCRSLSSIKIPKSVEAIPKDAFSNCRSLSSVQFAGEITSIGESAFQNCENLTQLDIPKSVRRIERNAFQGCRNLRSISVPDIGEIEDNLFRNCASLSEITIPENVTRIGIHSFDGCRSLGTVILPGRVRTIGAYAFNECRALKRVVLPEYLEELGQCGFYKCVSLQSIEMEDCGLTEINEQTFAFCESLGGITLPKSLNHIRESAFFGCNNLSRVTVRTELQSISPNAFPKEDNHVILFIIQSGYSNKGVESAEKVIGIISTISNARYTYEKPVQNSFA